MGSRTIGLDFRQVVLGSSPIGLNSRTGSPGFLDDRTGFLTGSIVF